MRLSVITEVAVSVGNAGLLMSSGFTRIGPRAAAGLSETLCVPLPDTECSRAEFGTRSATSCVLLEVSFLSIGCTLLDISFFFRYVAVPAPRGTLIIVSVRTLRIA